MIVQQRINIEGINDEEKDALTRVQEILYATEEGFEVCHLSSIHVAVWSSL